MNWVLVILLIIVMAGILYVLVRGVMLMASGKDLTGEQSQQWMRRRVALQAVGVAIIVLLLVVAGASRG